MSEGLDLRIAELERRFENVIRHGTIAAADYPSAKVKVAFSDELTSGWLPWFTTRAAGDEVTWSAPEFGERVTVLSPNGDIHQGRVMPAVYSDQSPAPSVNPDVSTAAHKDGGHFTYDRKTHRYVLQPHTDGSIRLLVGTTEINIDKTTILVKADEAVDVVAQTVTITADAVNLGGTGGKPVARVGDKVNSKTHIIEGGSDVTKSI